MKIKLLCTDGEEYEVKAKDHDHAVAWIETFRTSGWATVKGIWIPFHSLLRVYVPEDK